MQFLEDAVQTVVRFSFVMAYTWKVAKEEFSQYMNCYLKSFLMSFVFLALEFRFKHLETKN